MDEGCYFILNFLSKEIELRNGENDYIEDIVDIKFDRDIELEFLVFDIDEFDG